MRGYTSPAMGLLSGMGTVLIIIAVIVVILLLAIFCVRSYDMAKESVASARDGIRECRKQRLTLMNQVLSMFSEGNPHADNLSKLIDIYKSVNSEEREIKWEEKYIHVMQAYMEYAQVHCAPQMQISCKLANDAIIENEQKLDAARQSYLAEHKKLGDYEAFPRSLFVTIGTKISDMIKAFQANKEKAQANADEATRQQELNQQYASQSYFNQQPAPQQTDVQQQAAPQYQQPIQQVQQQIPKEMQAPQQ